MKISIITAVFNGAATLEDCIKSVQSQSYPHIEHVIIDGGSTDGTLDVIKKYKDKLAKTISEPDKGIYDALNKGIRMVTGEIIGFLHADDLYANDKVIETVVDVFIKNDVDSCYGDLQYVDKVYTNKVIRYWRSCPYEQGLFQKGWHPPHPTFFVKNWVYEKYGSFNTDFKISSDYELMLRFLEIHKISSVYIPKVLVKMRVGGKSNRSLKNIVIQSFEDYRACKLNGMNNAFYTILLKKLRKGPQFILR